MSITPGGPGSATYNSQVPQQAPSSRLAYVKAVLAKGGWPDTPGNEQFLLNWAEREHNVSDTKHASAAYNLLNTGWSMPGATAFNSVVKDYPDFQTGVAATVATIKQSLYKTIQDGLAAGDAAAWDAAGRFATALHTWSAGPNGPSTEGYTTVSNVNGGDGPLTGRGTSISNTAGDTAGAGGTNLYGDIDGFLQSQAPALAKAVSDPEVQQLLQLWGQNKLSTEDFQNRLEATNWWRTTPLSQRQQLIAQATDPATAAQNLNNQLSSINTLADQLGVGLTGGQAEQIASDSIKNQWSNDQIKQAVSKYALYQGDITYKGQAAVDVQQLRALYASYALPVSTPTLTSQLQSILGGTQTIDDFKQGLAQQAKGLYAQNNPLLASSLDRGLTVDDAMSTYRDIAVNELGVNPSDVNWLDPKWGTALTGTRDPSTGNYQVMSPFDWQKRLQTDPIYGYTTTPKGIQQGVDIGTQLAHIFSGGA